MIVESKKELIEEILEVTHSPQSKAFYALAIEWLGEGRVREEFGYLKVFIREGSVENPAKYFTSLLKKALENTGKSTAGLDKKQEIENAEPRSRFDLFGELKPREIQKGEEGLDQAMITPYSKRMIPWATFVGADFFTLSTNRQKSDRVMARFPTYDGEIFHVPMIRGRFFPGDEERGILTVEEGRILGALENIWVQQGCNYTKYKKGVMCYCSLSMRKLAKLIGRKTIGGRDIINLKKGLVGLRSKPFYLELESITELKKSGVRGFGFTLVDGVTVIEEGEQGKENEDATFLVRFSDTYSRQLIERRVVSRPREILTIRSELTFLIRTYIEPILMKRKEGKDHSIELLHLIDVLNLPKAGWHNFKSKRREQIEKALVELNKMKSIDGRDFKVTIEQGLNPKDFLLVAKLEMPDQQNLPLKTDTASH